MKLRETLTTGQIIKMFKGEVVGIFPSMILSNDKFYSKLYDLCFGYYMQRSGEKTISLTYERLLQLVSEKIYTTTETAENLIGKLIRGKFIEKWNRVYDVLISEQYNALQNHDFTEQKTGNNQNIDTYNSTKAKQGTNTDTTTYDTNVEDNGKRGTSETTTRSAEDYNNVYGFNSTSPVGDTISNETTSETIVGEADKNTSHNIQTKKGTEAKQFGINESENHTGTDTTDISIDENLNRSGRNVSGAELINEELNLRNTQLFFDIIYSDIDSIATLKIYI